MFEGAAEAEGRGVVVDVGGEGGEGVGRVGVAVLGGHVDGGLVPQDVDLLPGQDTVHLVHAYKSSYTSIRAHF